MNNRYVYNPYSNPWESNHPTLLKQPNMRLARAYVPYQIYTKSYSPKEALEKGTMFPELYSPYDDHQKKGM